MTFTNEFYYDDFTPTAQHILKSLMMSIDSGCGCIGILPYTSVDGEIENMLIFHSVGESFIVEPLEAFPSPTIYPFIDNLELALDNGFERSTDEGYQEADVPPRFRLVFTTFSDHERKYETGNYLWNINHGTLSPVTDIVMNDGTISDNDFWTTFSYDEPSDGNVEESPKAILIDNMMNLPSSLSSGIKKTLHDAEDGIHYVLILNGDDVSSIAFSKHGDDIQSLTGHGYRSSIDDLIRISTVTTDMVLLFVTHPLSALSSMDKDGNVTADALQILQSWNILNGVITPMPLNEVSQLGHMIIPDGGKASDYNIRYELGRDM